MVNLLRCVLNARAVCGAALLLHVGIAQAQLTLLGGKADLGTSFANNYRTTPPSDFGPNVFYDFRDLAGFPGIPVTLSSNGWGTLFFQIGGGSGGGTIATSSNTRESYQVGGSLYARSQASIKATFKTDIPYLFQSAIGNGAYGLASGLVPPATYSFSAASLGNAGNFSINTRLVARPNVSPILDPVLLVQLNDSLYHRTEGAENYSRLNVMCPVTTCSRPDGFNVQAYGTSDRSSIVIAIAGLDLNNTTSISAVLSFGKGTATEDLSSYVRAAREYLGYVRASNPGATVTLTGLSMGGAIAQLLGEAGNLPTVAFNGLAAGGLRASLSGELAPLRTSPLPGDKYNLNYRTYGDLASVVNAIETASIGTTITIRGVAPDEDIDRNPFAYLQENHLLPALLSGLKSDAAFRVGVPDVSLDTLKQIYPSTAPAPDVKTFESTVNGSDQYVFDPPAGTRFQLLANDTSPFFRTLDLPFLTGVSAYSLLIRTGDTWSDPIALDPGTTFSFHTGVSGIEVSPLDSQFELVVLENGFWFGVTFDGEGTFSGRSVVLQAVSEPTSASFMIAGALFMLLLSRARSDVTKRLLPPTIESGRARRIDTTEAEFVDYRA